MNDAYVQASVGRGVHVVHDSYEFKRSRCSVAGCKDGVVDAVRKIEVTGDGDGFCSGQQDVDGVTAFGKIKVVGKLGKGDALQATIVNLFIVCLHSGFVQVSDSDGPFPADSSGFFPAIRELSTNSILALTTNV